jgi:alkanesulfonate monooxygenase SsuD/methylene tetrahydromethanopterin reductase-like flavin-dependent oxidoreductase (luciferase family)
LHVGDAEERIDRLEEALQIIPALWKGQPVSYQGKHYTLDAAIAVPPGQPPPRLIVAALLPRTARLAAKYADGVNFTWYNRERIPGLFSAVDEALKENGRSREGFECSLHARWTNLDAEPRRTVGEWEAMGFDRVVIYLEPPFPLEGIRALAAQGQWR